MLQAAPEFQGITEHNEKILWQGKPVFWPFVLHCIPFLAVGIPWGVFDLAGLAATIQSAKHANPALMIFFFLMHSIPAWGSLLYCIFLVLVHDNTLYAYTNRRMLLRSGVFGTSFKSIDYDRIQELDVSVGIIERLFDVGTVRAFSGTLTSKGTPVYDRFVSISDPYGVYRGIKGVEVDVKTDWNYPNELRPAVNPGYHSEYRA